jgi:hypothetical protein
MQKKELAKIKQRNQAAKLADTSNVTDIHRTIKGVTGFNWQGTGNERTSTEKAFMPNENRLYFGKKPTGKARERFLYEQVSSRSVAKHKAKTGDQKPVMERKR